LIFFSDAPTTLASAEEVWAMSKDWTRKIKRNASRAAVLATALALLAACGTDPQDRAEGGAATGAASGAAIGIIGGPIGVVGGALIGGGVGALAGVGTSPSQVNLGTPPWSDK
jgi:phage tail tape-measure protein